MIEPPKRFPTAPPLWCGGALRNAFGDSIKLQRTTIRKHKLIFYITSSIIFYIRIYIVRSRLYEVVNDFFSLRSEIMYRGDDGPWQLGGTKTTRAHNFRTKRALFDHQ